MNKKIIASVALAMVLVGAASATTYKWTWNSATHVDGNQAGGGDLWYNAGGGGVKTITSEFNTANNNLKYEVNFSTQQTNGYWLALSQGDNPKGHAGELALFYFDASQSAPVLLAYNYNGVNGDTSHYDGSQAAGTQAPDLILSSKTTTNWINQLQVINNIDGTRTMKFDIDATTINNHVPLYPGNTPWDGAEFGNKMGIWFHQVKGLSTTYNAGGGLNTWNHQGAGYLDGSNLQTVPEPMTMTALALGLAGVARRRRNSK